jgi:hypothetical protein
MVNLNVCHDRLATYVECGPEVTEVDDDWTPFQLGIPYVSPLFDRDTGNVVPEVMLSRLALSELGAAHGGWLRKPDAPGLVGRLAGWGNGGRSRVS